MTPLRPLRRALPCAAGAADTELPMCGTVRTGTQWLKPVLVDEGGQAASVLQHIPRPSIIHVWQIYIYNPLSIHIILIYIYIYIGDDLESLLSGSGHRQISPGWMKEWIQKNKMTKSIGPFLDSQNLFLEGLHWHPSATPLLAISALCRTVRSALCSQKRGRQRPGTLLPASLRG